MRCAYFEAHAATVDSDREPEELAALVFGGNETHKAVKRESRAEQNPDSVVHHFAFLDVLKERLPVVKAAWHRLRLKRARDRHIDCNCHDRSLTHSPSWPISREAMGVETTILPSRLHHHAYVVADQERTRHFYEDMLGMPLVATWCEREHVRGKEREYCHTFFSLADGSALAFFQFADADDHTELFSSSPQSLNHVALAVDQAGQNELVRRLEASKVPHRVIDHGYCRSLYITDPDGLAVEFTCDSADV